MLVVVGGHSRNIGKTAVACSIIKALAHLNWTAIKITQYGHGLCSRNGEPCPCDNPTHRVAVSEEPREAVQDPDRLPPDSARFLIAGAARAFWVRTPIGHLDEAMPRVRQLLTASANVIIESNSILRFVKPDFCAMVVDGAVADFKPTSQRFLDRADALARTSDAELLWPGIPQSLLRGIPCFPAPPPCYHSDALVAAVRSAQPTA